jgi:hypothetical protein
LRSTFLLKQLVRFEGSALLGLVSRPAACCNGDVCMKATK